MTWLDLIQWHSCNSATRAIVAIISTTLIAGVTVADNYTEYSRPGGVAVIDFDTDSNTVPQVLFGREKIAVVRSAGGWRAFVGLNPNLIPGDYVVAVHSEGKSNSLPFRVEPPYSPSRDLTSHLPNSAHADGTRAGDDQVVDTPPLPGQPECAQLPVKMDWRDASLGSTHMELPLPLLSRRLTQPAKLIQPGVWLQVDQLESIRSPGGGIVIDVNPPEAQSTALVIDHGQGVISILCPVINPLVTLEAELTRGQALGEVAGDGRLWWTMMLNGHAINPLTTTHAAGY